MTEHLEHGLTPPGLSSFESKDTCKDYGDCPAPSPDVKYAGLRWSRGGAGAQAVHHPTLNPTFTNWPFVTMVVIIGIIPRMLQ